MTEHSASEVCTVAGFLSYKICRLAFRLNLPRWTIDILNITYKNMVFSQGCNCPIPEAHGSVQGIIRPSSAELGACSLAGTTKCPITKLTLSTHTISQAGQAAAFGHLFSEAVRAGQSAVQTQHPGLYFQLGAEYAISRFTTTSWKILKS